MQSFYMTCAKIAQKRQDFARFALLKKSTKPVKILRASLF